MSTIQLTDRSGNPVNFETTVLEDGNSVAVQTLTDAAGNQIQVALGQLATQNGGQNSKLNMMAAGVVKAAPGRLRRIVIVAPGSGSGAFTVNDTTTTGGAAAANVIWTLPYNSALNIAGQSFPLDWPCLVGIVLSAVPGSGSPIIALSYD